MIKPFVDAWNYLFGNTIWSSETISEVFSGILDVLTTIGEFIFELITLPFRLAFDAISSIVEGIMDFIGIDISSPDTSVEAGKIAGTAASTAVANNTEQSNVTVTTESGEEISMADVVERLDTLIGVFTDGIDMKWNGAKMGEMLAKTART